MGTMGTSLRRGLPRIAGGEPWPPAGATSGSASAPIPVATAASASAGDRALRRGLPRVAGGEPWPPAGSVPAPLGEARPDATLARSVGGETPAAVTRADVAPEPLAASVEAEEPRRWGRWTRRQWIGVGVVSVVVATLVAAVLVLAVRALLSSEWGVSLLASYPGEYELPESAPVGLPAWIAWQHFFNAFFMVLIIRTGLQIRSETRPAAYWTSRRRPESKMSLTIWFHQSLDVLWLVNGALFVVLLAVTGHWMRIVPTSWEVFPNALSAALQYVSLDWPTENGWVNYNSLQQLAYFTTVFIAAPLAALTGVRLSSVWPSKAATLSRLYPTALARAIHFPVMLYFVLFIAVHVGLALATGALRNLNHIYAAQGSTDPTAYADNWVGFVLFVISLLVIAAAWVAARPTTLAPVARLFGTVTSR